MEAFSLEGGEGDPVPESTVDVSVQQQRQTARARFLPLFLVGALAIPAGLAVSLDAVEKPREAQKAEDPALAALRVAMARLIADLDSSHFRDRERAQARLRQLVTEWVRLKKEPIPFESLLIAKGYSAEQSQRLEKVYAAYDTEKTNLLWRPTAFVLPKEWEKRKTPPSVAELLKELEVQSWRPISLRLPPRTPWDRDRADTLERQIPEKLQGKTLLEALAAVRKAAGESYALHHWFDDSLMIEDVSHHKSYAFTRPLRTWTDAKGSLLAQLSGPYPESTPQGYNRMSVDLLTEPKIILGQARIVHAKGTAETGKEFTIDVEGIATEFLRAGRGFSVRIPPVPGAKKVSLSLEMECVGHVPMTVPIADPKKGQEIVTPFCKLQFQGVHGTRERRTDQRMIWQARTTTPEEYHTVLERTHLLRCRAFDVKGQRIQSYGSGAQNWPQATFVWEFLEEPHRLEFLIPGRSTTTTQTFTFPDVSLEPLPRIERGEGEGVSGAVWRLLRPWLPRE